MHLSIILELCFLLWIIIDILELYKKISKVVVYNVETIIMSVLSILLIYTMFNDGNCIMMNWLSQHIVFDIIMVITMMIFMSLNLYMFFKE